VVGEVERDESHARVILVSLLRRGFGGRWRFTMIWLLHSSGGESVSGDCPAIAADE
jgi:hypothetical protein